VACCAFICSNTAASRLLSTIAPGCVNYPDGRFNGAVLGFKVFDKIQTVRRVQEQHHPVVVQVARHCALLPPGQHLVQVIG
jgi:hypothetical protein